MNDNATYRYLDFVGFNALTNWSVQYLKDSVIRFNGRYPLKRIGDFLVRNRTVIAIQDGVKYNRVTVRVRNGGVSLRDEVMGDDIGTKRQFVVSAGQFIISRIDARNGAMGIIPADLDGAVVTQDFLSYDIDAAQIDPQYFVLVCTTGRFIAFCQNCSSGTTNRRRVSESQFLNIKVPVPSLEVQQLLVNGYNRQMSMASDLEHTVVAKQKEINSLLMSELGVEISKKSSIGLSTIAFSSLNRWDAEYLLNTSKYSSKYPSKRLAECVDSFMRNQEGDSLRVETYKMPSEEFRYIGMENIEKATGQLIAAPKVKGSQIKSQTIAVPKGYFLYGKLRPYLNKYWYNDTDWNDIVCSSEFFVFNIKKDETDTRFFKYVLGSDIVQHQVVDLASGARMPRITEDVFMNIRIPVPPMDIQIRIANHIDEMAKSIRELKSDASNRRVSAMADFEAEIFSR